VARYLVKKHPSGSQGQIEVICGGKYYLSGDVVEMSEEEAAKLPAYMLSAPLDKHGAPSAKNPAELSTTTKEVKPSGGMERK
jgi:hypothetical protein